MRIQLKVKVNGKWRWVKCEHCGSRLEFSSFKKSSEYAKSKGHTNYLATRVD